MIVSDDGENHHSYRYGENRHAFTVTPQLKSEPKYLLVLWYSRGQICPRTGDRLRVSHYFIGRRYGDHLPK